MYLVTICHWHQSPPFKLLLVVDKFVFKNKISSRFLVDLFNIFDQWTRCISRFFFFFWAIILVSFICLAEPMAVKMKLIFTLILETTLHSSLKKYTLGVLMFKIKIILQMVVHFLRWEWGVRVMRLHIA